MFVGSLGVARFPDFFERIHSSGLPATLGVAAVLLASSIYLSAHFGEVFLKPIIALIILFLTAPLGIEMLARAGYITRVKPAQEYERDETDGAVGHKEPVE